MHRDVDHAKQSKTKHEIDTQTTVVNLGIQRYISKRGGGDAVNHVETGFTETTDCRRLVTSEAHDITYLTVFMTYGVISFAIPAIHM